MKGKDGRRVGVRNGRRTGGRDERRDGEREGGSSCLNHQHDNNTPEGQKIDVPFASHGSGRRGARRRRRQADGWAR